MKMRNIDNWKGIHEGNSRGRYPESTLVSLLYRMFRTQKALDVGCGAGRHLRLLFELGFKVYGVDVEEAIKKIINNYSVLRSCDFSQEIPFKDNLFDLVLDCRSIQHSDNVYRTMKEVYRVLNDTGVFISYWIREATNEEYDYPPYNPFQEEYLSEFHILKQIEIQDLDETCVLIIAEKGNKKGVVDERRNLL